MTTSVARPAGLAADPACRTGRVAAVIFADEPYVLQFLDLKDEYLESDLEVALIGKLEAPIKRPSSEEVVVVGNECFKREFTTGTAGDESIMLVEGVQKFEFVHECVPA